MSEGPSNKAKESEARLRVLLAESALETQEAKALWRDWCIKKEEECGIAQGSQIAVMLAKATLLIDVAREGASAKAKLVERAKEELYDARDSAEQEGNDEIVSSINNTLAGL